MKKLSKKSIYEALRLGGLSVAGACAMMGNMEAESNCISIRVQGDNKYPYQYSCDYTNQVDIGNISRHEFIHDGPNGGGYGLCQWTYPTRKADLYDLAKSKSVSIGDEQMQCDLCIMELKRDYPELYDFLCTTDNISKAAEDICSKFERPAVNNFAFRINAAMGFYNEFADVEVDTGYNEDSCPIEPEIQVDCWVDVRMLKKGNLGRDVFLLQCGLADMKFNCGIPDGDFGVKTEEAVRQLQRANDLLPSGIADARVWKIILKER